MRVTYTDVFDDDMRRAIVAYFAKRFGDKLRRKDGLANRADILRFMGEALDNHWIAVEDELNDLNADADARSA